MRLWCMVDVDVCGNWIGVECVSLRMVIRMEMFGYTLVLRANGCVFDSIKCKYCMGPIVRLTDVPFFN